MTEIETATLSDQSTNDDLSILKLSKIEGEFLKKIYHYAKYFSILAGNTQNVSDVHNSRETQECLKKIRDSRWNYEKILEKKNNGSSPKTTVIKMDSLKLLKSGIPENFKIGLIELNISSKAFDIDSYIHELELKGSIKGIADMYLNYSIASAVLDQPEQEWKNIDTLLDLSIMYRKKEGTRHNAYFSFIPTNEPEHMWMPRSIDFPFYPPAKIAVWL
jgi:hypothetical protein